MAVSNQSLDGTNPEVLDWSDLGGRMWTFLTGREAAINYTFSDMVVEIPRDTGSDAPRATWRIDGTLTVTTNDVDSPELMQVVEVSADLTVDLSGADGEVAHGHLTGTQSRLTLDIDHPSVFAGTGDAPVVRAAAEGLAARGITVRVVHDGVHLVTIGAVSAPWWQRRATGSRRIAVGSWRGIWASLRSRAGNRSAVLPSAESLPPPTMYPLLPTFARPRRRTPTTTHSSDRSGSPRLVVERADLWQGEGQAVFWLDGVETTIGSDSSCDVVLPGLEPHHASVLLTDTDEYVLTNLGPETRVHGALVTGSATLRTGARINLGEHALAYAREEYADHGRPFGGRIGGEAGRQRPQPPRRGHDPASAGR